MCILAQRRIEDVCRMNFLLRERAKFNREGIDAGTIWRGQQEVGSGGKGKIQSWGDVRFLPEAGVITGPGLDAQVWGEGGRKQLTDLPTYPLAYLPVSVFLFIHSSVHPSVLSPTCSSLEFFLEARLIS